MRIWILLLLLISSNSFAGGSGDGGWISSGGEIYQDAHNPWFIQNTSKINWCLVTSPGKQSVTDSKIAEIIERSLLYWRKELDQDTETTVNFPGFSTGQQIFQRISCSSANVDLRIIFGKDALQAEELSYLVNPDRYVGVSVRTAYDTKSLKGKGFIYFSSDQDSTNLNIPANLWQNERVLQYAISHELGHVFGIPHTGSGLMAEHFLELIANPHLTEYFNRLPMNNFLKPLSNFNACGWMLNSSFFQLPEEEGKPVWCVRFKQTDNTDTYELEAFRAQANAEKIFLGKIVPNPKDLELQKMIGEEYPMSFLYLTKEQNVFDRAPSTGVMVGPRQVEKFYRAEWQSAAGGEKKPLFILSQSKYFRAIGIQIKNELPEFVNVITYSSQINRIFSAIILMP